MVRLLIAKMGFRQLGYAQRYLEVEVECLYGVEGIEDSLTKINIINMKLIELIKYLTNPELLEELFLEQGLNIESEVLLIYMEGDLDLTSDISILEIEETEDDLIFEKDGLQYIQLFPIDYAIDLIEFDLNMKDKGYSDLEIAERLLEYRKNDA